MKNKCPFYIIFQVLKVRLIKMCKIEPPDLLFIVALISFYISRYHFSQICTSSFKIYLKKKKICLKFFFFNRFTKIPTPLNGQNPVSVTKVFCRCSLNGKK